jgi:hypothetical protein
VIRNQDPNRQRFGPDPPVYITVNAKNGASHRGTPESESLSRPSGEEPGNQIKERTEEKPLEGLPVVVDIVAQLGFMIAISRPPSKPCPLDAREHQRVYRPQRGTSRYPSMKRKADRWDRVSEVRHLGRRECADRERADRERADRECADQ